MEKSSRKYALKSSPRPFLILVINPKQPFHARNSFKNKIWKEDHLKNVKKLTLLFLSNPVPFNGQDYKNQRRPGTSDQSFLSLQSRFRKISLLVMYYLTKFDDII